MVIHNNQRNLMGALGIFALAFYFGLSYGETNSKQEIERLEGTVDGFVSAEAAITVSTQCANVDRKSTKDVFRGIECGTLDRAEELQSSIHLNDHIIGRLCKKALTDGV